MASRGSRSPKRTRFDRPRPRDNDDNQTSPRSNIPYHGGGGDYYRPAESAASSRRPSHQSPSDRDAPITPQTPAPMASMIPTGPQRITAADRDDNEFMKLLSEFSEAHMQESDANVQLAFAQYKLAHEQQVLATKGKQWKNHEWHKQAREDQERAIQDAQTEVQTRQANFDKCQQLRGDNTNALADAWRRIRHSGDANDQASALEAFRIKLDQLSSQHDSRVLSRLKEQQDHLQRQVESLDPRLITLQQQCRSLEAKRAEPQELQHQTRSEELQKQFDDLIGAVDARSQDCHKQSVELVQLESRVDELSTKMEEVGPKMNDQDLVQTVSTTSSTLQNLSGDVSQTSLRVDQLQDTVKGMDKDFGDTLDDFTSEQDKKWEDKLLALEKKFDDRLDEHKQQIGSSTRDQLQGLQNENTKLQSANADLTQDINTLKEQYRASSALIETLQAGQNSLKKRLPVPDQLKSVNPHAPPTPARRSMSGPVPSPVSASGSPVQCVQSPVTPNGFNLMANGVNGAGPTNNDAMARLHSIVYGMSNQIQFLNDRYNNTTSEQVVDAMLKQFQSMYPIANLHAMATQLRQHTEFLQKLGSIGNTVSHIQKALTSGENSHRLLQGRVDSIASDLSAFDNQRNVSRLPQQQASTGVSLPATTQTATSLRDIVEKSITAFREDIKATDERQARHNASIIELQNDVKTLKETSHNDNTSDLFQQLELLHPALEKLKGEVGEAKSTYQSSRLSESRIDEIEKKLRDLEPRLAKVCEASNATLPRRIGDSEAKSSELETRLDQYVSNFNKRFEQEKLAATDRLQDTLDRAPDGLKTDLEQRANDDKTDVEQQMKDLASSAEIRLSNLKTSTDKHFADIRTTIEDQETRISKYIDQQVQIVGDKVKFIDDVMKDAAAQAEKQRLAAASDDSDRSRSTGKEPATSSSLGSKQQQKQTKRDDETPGHAQRLQDLDMFKVSRSPAPSKSRDTSKRTGLDNGDQSKPHAISTPTSAAEQQGSVTGSSSNARHASKKRERTSSNTPTVQTAQSKKRRIDRPKSTLPNTPRETIELD